jgi:hypothetical protein
MKRLKTSSRALDGDFEKNDQGPQSNWFRNNRLPSDFIVNVGGVDVEVISIVSQEFRNPKLKIRMVSFEALNLLIKESYDSKHAEHDL